MKVEPADRRMFCEPPGLRHGPSPRLVGLQGLRQETLPGLEPRHGVHRPNSPGGWVGDPQKYPHGLQGNPHPFPPENGQKA